MVIEKNTILYFTGTGNSLQVAKDISDTVEGFELCPIASFADEKEIEVKAGTLGIVFPVYFACMPLIVENVAKKLKFGKESYVFAVATMGGSPGAVLDQLNNILSEKGKALNSGFSVSMPGNYIVKYGAFPQSMQKRSLNKAALKIKDIAAVVSAKKDRKLEKSKIVIDRIFTKTMHGKIEKIHSTDKEFHANDACNGCGTCARVCPVKNIEIKNAKPEWKHKCEHCMACIQYCPKEAIQWGDKTAKRKRYRNPNINLIEYIKNNVNSQE